jgi:glycosyltransferase involved in cell wall biosynthesis
MEAKILFVSQKQKRGGAIYEDQVKKILEKEYNLDVLELNVQKNKILFFNKLKYFYQIKSHHPGKRYKTLITNKAGVYAGILSRKSDKKILILHHYYSDENIYPFVNIFLKNKLLSNLKKFNSIIVVSEYWKKYFSNYISENKIEIIYNSFDINKINSIQESINVQSFKKKYNIPDEKIIVYAGNALKIKGYDEVINQLKNNDAYFIITSGNKDKNATLQHLHLTLDYTEYIQLLCSADITVILSKFQEGWNRIAHESLICGTPVIGTGVAGMGELLQKANQTIWNEGDNLQVLIKNSIGNSENTFYGKKYASQYDLEYLKNRWGSVLI